MTILIIGLVLYSFSQNQLVEAEKTLLEQRSQTANAGAQDFLESLRDPEDQSLPPAENYAEELVTTVADPTGLEVLYVGTTGEPLAARDGSGNPLDPGAELRELGFRGGYARGGRPLHGGRGPARLERGPLRATSPSGRSWDGTGPARGP